MRSGSMEQELQGALSRVRHAAARRVAPASEFGLLPGPNGPDVADQQLFPARGMAGPAADPAAFVIPGENGEGVRLVVNETRSTGAEGAGQFCMGFGQEAGVTFAAGKTGESFGVADEYSVATWRSQDPQDPDLDSDLGIAHAHTG